MKQKQIMSNNKMKCLSKLVVIMMFIFFSYCSFGPSKKSSIEAIKVENKIRLFSFQEVEYAILKISYKNISKDTIYLWTQNWRVHYLKEQDSSMFNNCPFDINAGFLNAIVFLKVKMLQHLIQSLLDLIILKLVIKYWIVVLLKRYCQEKLFLRI